MSHKAAVINLALHFQRGKCFLPSNPPFKKHVGGDEFEKKYAFCVLGGDLFFHFPFKHGNVLV